MAYPAQPADANTIPVSSAYNPITNIFKAIRGVNKVTDATPNDSYAVATSPEDGWKTTYSASITGLIPGATPQDIFTLTGSATTKTKVTRLEISGLATASTWLEVQLLKRSTANATGTFTSPTRVPLDSGNAAATATVLAYTANAGTAGTLVGAIRNFKMLLPLVTLTATDFPTVDRVVLTWGQERPGQCPTLHGITDVFAVNLNGITAITGWTFDINIEWSEELL